MNFILTFLPHMQEFLVHLLIIFLTFMQRLKVCLCIMLCKALQLTLFHYLTFMNFMINYLPHMEKFLAHLSIMFFTFMQRFLSLHDALQSLATYPLSIFHFYEFYGNILTSCGGISRAPPHYVPHFYAEIFSPRKDVMMSLKKCL